MEEEAVGVRDRERREAPHVSKIFRRKRKRKGNF